MTGVVCDHYNSCLITPQQTLPNNFRTMGEGGFMNCVSYIPPQQGGFIVGNNYHFSDGFSIDPCCNNLGNPFSPGNLNYGHNDFNYKGEYNFSNDYSFAEGVHFYPNSTNTPRNGNNPEECQEVHFNEQFPEKEERDYFQVTGTEVLPEGFNEEGKVLPLTPSFFASNAAFKRIPINSGRSIFRKRKAGDCTGEWSNAFDKDYDDGLCLHEEPENK